MYRSIEDFVADWNNERQGTQRLLDRLTDASLDQQVDEGGRTLGGLAWHLATTLGAMLGQAGVEIEGPAPDAPRPERAEQIAATYRGTSAAVGDAVRRAWTDEQLEEVVEVFGNRVPRATVLTMLIRHEAHHRGQMTVLMRQAGLAVPGIYGPAREEWEAMGVPPLP
jgi:uncharacterized damage-inducible protein DinB